MVIWLILVRSAVLFVTEPFTPALSKSNGFCALRSSRLLRRTPVEFCTRAANAPPAPSTNTLSLPSPTPFTVTLFLPVTENEAYTPGITFTLPPAGTALIAV